MMPLPALRTAVPSLLLSLAVGLAGCGDEDRFAAPDNALPGTVEIGGQTIAVELALDLDSRRNGLMHRTGLTDEQGMLFVFPIVDRRTFWMRNTLISLDILFLEDDGTIINIRADCPPGVEQPGFSSESDCRVVLELRGGWCADHGVGPGDRVEFDPVLFERARP